MNKDVITATKAELVEAINKGNTEDFVDKTFDALAKSVSDEVSREVMAKYNEMKGVSDAAILESRGIHALTSEEKTFYDSLISMAKGAMTDTHVALPITIESRVYDDMLHDHELLQRINFVDSKGLTEWIISKNLDYAGAWGDLNDAVTSEAAAAFAKVEFSQYKLSAWIPVPKTMLDLGMTWLDQYVVTYLSEIIARLLENGIVNGTGQKMPVGMIKIVNIESQTVPAVDKTATAITDLSTTTIGEIAATLTNNGTRKVTMIDMIVNPADFWKLVYPALYYTNYEGQVVKSNVPINVIQSCAVSSGKAVFGLLDRYFATVGFGAPAGKIEYSDHYKFLEDVRTYKARAVAYGTPVDDSSFVYADISKLNEAAVPTRSQKTKTTA